MDTKDREYVPLNVRIYADEDSDLIEYLEGKPKTWLVKEALRFYRDNKDRPSQQPFFQIVKDIEYYMSLNYTYRFRHVEDDPNHPEGYYFGGFEELDGCHTDAPTVQELLAELEEVKRAWIETKLEGSFPIPEPKPMKG